MTTNTPTNPTQTATIRCIPTRSPSSGIASRVTTMGPANMIVVVTVIGR